MRVSALIASLGAAIAASAARADIIVYEAVLNNSTVQPPNQSAATGSANLRFDTAAHTVRVRVDFTGLMGPATQSAVHAPTLPPGFITGAVAIVPPTFPGFPVGMTSGQYEMTFDTLLPSTYLPGFLVNYGGGTPSGAEAALLAFLSQGRAYLSVHSTIFPGGEIRGFFTGVAACYADCNSDGALNLSDFGCFQTRFALGDPYADCNGDGVRNLSDFGCFQTKFALGCP